jgi:flagellar protein FlaG
MVNETSNATVIKLSSPVKFSGPNTNQGPGNVTGTQQAGKLPETGGQNLPLQGNGQPREVRGFVEIREAVNEINEFVQSVQRDLSFNMDEASGHTVIRVINRDSGDLIRQIPSEEVLAIASQIRDARETATEANEAPPGLLFSDST